MTSKLLFLARAGDCVACHTAPGGTPFAGGRAMPTPFGNLYVPNITPDDENLNALGSGSTVTYPRGTVAMANAGAGTNGSQFFLVYKDSPLPPNYTPFGTITKGLDVLDAIAKGGSTPPQDGKPNLAVTLKTAVVQG